MIFYMIDLDKNFSHVSRIDKLHMNFFELLFLNNMGKSFLR